MDRSSPAQMAMDGHFAKGRRGRGRPKVCLPVVLSQDLQKAKIKFGSADDLEAVRARAEDRDCWRALVDALAPKYI